MIDDAVPSGMAGRWAELERRIANLERAQRIRSSSIQGGALTIRQADGDEVATVGELPDGQDGFRVRALGQTFDHLNVNGNGVVVPAYGYFFRPVLAADHKQVTGGTFVSYWGCYLQYAPGKDLEFIVQVNVPTGTTMQLRLNRPSTAVIGEVVSIVGDSAYHTYKFKYPHGITVSQHLGTTVQVEGRLDSGAGPAQLHWPSQVSIHGLLTSVPATAWTLVG
jgi:hypothetical protein